MPELALYLGASGWITTAHAAIRAVDIRWLASRACGMLSAVGILDAIAGRVAAGSTVGFRPSGSSMAPLIRNRQLVTVAPVDPTKVEVGDIVMAKVGGTVYLHLVSAVDAAAGRVQISNNRGRVNGWTNHARIYGICTAVDGVRRPRIDGKIRGS